MIKQATILLFVTILLTGCIERGHILKPARNQTITPTLTLEARAQTSVSTTKIIKQNKTIITEEEAIKIELPKKDLSVKSNKTIFSEKVIMKPTTEKVETDFFSSLSDETKNNISGFFVMIISIIILL